MQACSTTHLFHYFFSDEASTRADIERDGLRPLSDFPDSERWREIEAHMPGFYRNLYGMMAQPVLRRPYENSGVFITPVDFRVVTGTHLHDKPRFRIPIDRIVAADTIVTYVIGDERRSLPFSAEILAETAAIWNEDMIRTWFGRDETKLFFHVPQVATYQGSTFVEPGDFEAA